MVEETNAFVIQAKAAFQKIENLKKDLIKQGFTETSPGTFEMLEGAPVEPCEVHSIFRINDGTSRMIKVCSKCHFNLSSGKFIPEDQWAFVSFFSGG